MLNRIESASADPGGCGLMLLSVMQFCSCEIADGGSVSMLVPRLGAGQSGGIPLLIDLFKRGLNSASRKMRSKLRNWTGRPEPLVRIFAVSLAVKPRSGPTIRLPVEPGLA